MTSNQPQIVASEGSIGRWVPDPGWQMVAGAGGSATRGVWRAERDGRHCIVKRLEPGGARSADALHHSWWRREAEVALSGILVGSQGLTAPSPISVDEDPDGITLWNPEVASTRIADDVLANAYGRFGSQSVQDPGWFNCGMLRNRITVTDEIGGLGPLRASGLIEDSLLRICKALWVLREQILDELDHLPRFLSHGDALPRNMLCLDDANVIAVDWGQLGYNTIGADLATLCLYAALDLAELIPAYCEGLREHGQPVEEATVRRATVQVAALIAVSRASRAVAAGSDADAYLGRLARAQPLLDEALHQR